MKLAFKVKWAHTSRDAGASCVGKTKAGDFCKHAAVFLINNRAYCRGCAAQYILRKIWAALP